MDDMTEIKTTLKAILDILPTLATKADVAELKADVAVLKIDVAGLKAGQARLEEDVTAIKGKLDVGELRGRVEEQSHILAALIPAKIAAVGR